jgi:DNA-binding GntR family transcriptional regulator
MTRRLTKQKKKTSSPSSKKDDLTLMAYNKIRKMLLFNEIAIGQKIHYPDIAKNLGISPTPVIQALKWLQFNGLVRHETNQGFYLEDISIEEIEELYALRESIEVTLLKRSLERLNEEGLDRVKNALDDLLEASRNKLPNIRIVKDMEFHMVIASLSGGRPGCLILQHVFDLLYLKYRTYLLMLKSGDKDHCNIFNRLQKNDGEGVVKALSSHIAGVGVDVVKQLRIHMDEKAVLEMN